MELIDHIFGPGKDLDAQQMACRGIMIFFIAFALIRISGRRSFGIHTAVDNIIVITLGATLSRAIVGASPFVAVIITCLVIVILHRILGWLMVHNPRVNKFFEGDKIVLFKKGRFIKKNLNRALVCEADVLQGVRRTAFTEKMDDIEIIYMERSGEISAIKK